MSFRFWLFLAGVSGAVAVLTGAYAAHGLATPPLKAFETAQIFHLVHTVALLGLAGLIAATEGRRHTFACLLTQLAGVAFLMGILLFVGGVYYHTFAGEPAPYRIVPAGGISFATGWALLALSAFGFRRAE